MSERVVEAALKLQKIADEQAGVDKPSFTVEVSGENLLVFQPSEGKTVDQIRGDIVATLQKAFDSTQRR